MPISAMDSYASDHWSDVKSIITSSIEAIGEFNFAVSLVSDADESGVIQKRIVQNLYSSAIVVCDVSGKNPNVMFELGMRLAFDKPTVIVKDDETDYSFDTSIIEHLTYPRDLRFSKVVSFKDKLAVKVCATYKKSIKDPEHSTFLKNFGKFQVANLSEDVATTDQIVLSILQDMQLEMSYIKSRVTSQTEGKKESLMNNFYVRSRFLAKKWSAEHKCQFEDLIDNNDFYEYAVDRLDAPNYFGSKSEFVEALNHQIKKLIP